MRQGVLMLAAVAAFAACGGDKGSAGGMSMRDSSGVAILEYDSTALSDAPLFVPSTTIYEMVGQGSDGMHNTSAIRTAALIGGGRFVGLEGRTNRVIMYDSLGTVLANFGSRGEGAGKLNAPGGLRAMSDNTIQIVDFPARVLQLSETDLTVMRESNVGPAEPVLAVLLLQTGPGSAIAVETEGEGSGSTNTQYLLRVGRDKVDTLTKWTGSEAAEFGRPAVSRAWGDRIVTNGEGWNIAIRDSLGAINRSVSVKVGTREVTPAMRDSVLVRLRRQIEALALDDKAVVADAMRSIDQKTFATTLPAIDDIVEARDGTIWIGEFALVSDPFRFYTVMDTEGKIVRRIRVAVADRVLAADGEMAVIRSLDDAGKAHLKLVRFGSATAAQ